MAASSGRVDGKVAIVTGAGAEEDEIGIGRAIALLLAREGAKLVCLDVSLERAEATARMIRTETGDDNAVAVAADITKAEECDAAVRHAIGAFGRLDVLVNNVGIAGRLELVNIDLSAWQKTLDINLTGAMLMCSAAVPQMIRGGGGAIVNISSIAGIVAAGGLAYGPSKAALHQLSKEIAVLHGRDGIRVNTVAPGHMATPMAMRLLPADMREKRRKVSPLGIEGDAWDIARAVLFLASDEARYVNAVHLPVDGGVTALAPLTGADFLND